MKKFICLAIAVIMIMSCVMVSAEEIVTVKINDKVIDFDVPAQIINDRTMVPMRKIFEELDATVTWIDELELVVATKDEKIVSLAINSNILLINDTKTGETKKVELDVPAQLVNDRTLVPARAVSEALDAKVDWDEASQTVLIEL